MGLRFIWLALAVFTLILAACARPGPGATDAIAASSGPNATANMSIESIDYQELPAGLGRGYPVLTFDGIETGQSGLRPGQPPPNFRMVLEDGSSLSLADLQGSPVLINFWATWCGPCRLEMPDIVRHYNEDEDLIVLAVNVQEELEPIEAFAADFQMNMPIVRDRDGDLRRIYELQGMPTSIFLDRAGNVTAVWPGVLTPSQIREFLDDILSG